MTCSIRTAADYRAVAVNLHDRGDSSGPLGAPMILPVARGIRHKGLRCLCDCRSSRAPPGHLTLATEMRVLVPTVSTVSSVGHTLGDTQMRVPVPLDCVTA